MAISSDNIKKAFEIKEKAIKKADFLYNKALENAISSEPRIEEINHELSNIGAILMMAALQGDTDRIALLKKKSDSLSDEKKTLLDKAGVKPKQIFCQVCGDTGYNGAKICDCIKSIAKEIALSEMEKAMPLSKSSFQSFVLKYYPDEAKDKMSNIFSFAKKYADDFSESSGNILFMGKSGLGKTHISLSIVREVVSKGYNVVYGSAQNLFSEAEKEHFSYSGENEKRNRLLEADLLVIDDLGTEFITNFVQSLIYDIINTRLLKGKPTIINTNLNIDELESRYTARITSRFIGEYCMKTFVGNDIRLLKKIENKE
ncbi:MAG: ATP-binding protein [Acutalibacteraceae bacterium]|nr:ATP-binding protein [Acutalibacteraceae bacterium]